MTNKKDIEFESDNVKAYVQQIQAENGILRQENERLKKQNEILLKNIKKLQNKLCSSTSQCKYFLIDVLNEVENV